MSLELKDLITGLKQNGFTNAAHRLGLTADYLEKNGELPASLNYTKTTPDRSMPTIPDRAISHFPFETPDLKSHTNTSFRDLIYLKLSLCIATLVPSIAATREALIHFQNGNLPDAALYTAGATLSFLTAFKLINSAGNNARQLSNFTFSNTQQVF